jgi:thiol-disulfide isomerase/thioredoxin
MIHKSRILILLLISSCAVLLFALQGANPEFERELEAGRQAAEQQNYVDSIGHFARANELQQGKCSECYVWLARIALAGDKLQDALGYAEKGVATATTNTERGRAELYRGMVLGRQGDLSQAEAAFKAASTDIPGCVECKFNLGYVLLKESKDAEGAAVLKAIAPQFAGTPRGREVQRFIDDPSRVRKHYAPEFSARLRSGEEVNLDTLKGKVVLFDFWGTWCAPCRGSLPKLKDLAARVDPTKVTIISVDEGDPKQRWEQFIEANGMNWPQVYDGDRSLYRAFNVDGFPRYYLLSKDGIILAEFKGWGQLGESTISNAIVQALKQ